jgi:8-oxo-dGTP diphosphatase
MPTKNSQNPPWSGTNSAGYQAPAALAVDVVVLTVREHQLVALALQRAPKLWALPGGFVGPKESPEQTANRKLTEKTGLPALYLEQLGTFAAPDRDPRGWIPTVAHLALVPPETTATDQAADWIPVNNPPRLAYDHVEILNAAVERVRGKLWWSNIAVGIHPETFTLAQARETYEAIGSTTYDASTFARDLRATGLIETAPADRATTGGRPAAVYRFREKHPAWGSGRRKRVRS